jgi:hypothetical protein
MSTLWTPDGEHPVGRPQPETAQQAPRADQRPRPDPAGAPSDEELRARMAELQEQLAATPAEVVVANHAYSLFELAALHLSRQPPQLAQARLAIDALAALVEGLAGRLGDAEASLVDGLAQLRLAFVQISKTPQGPSQPRR